MNGFPISAHFPAIQQDSIERIPDHSEKQKSRRAFPTTPFADRPGRSPEFLLAGFHRRTHSECSGALDAVTDGHPSVCVPQTVAWGGPKDRHEVRLPLAGMLIAPYHPRPFGDPSMSGEQKAPDVRDHMPTIYEPTTL